MNIQAQAARLAAPYEETVREYRHHLHANPELSFEEVKTAAFIREQGRVPYYRTLDALKIRKSAVETEETI